MVFQLSQAFYKIYKASKSKKTIIVQGSQGASKTISILMLMIGFAEENDEAELSVFGHELTKLKKTVFRDFRKIMKSWDKWDRNNWKSQESIYTFSNGSYIEFIGLDRTDIGKGFRRDAVYFNEANRGIEYEAFRQVQSRTRHKVFLDFNPDAEFWAHSEVQKEHDATTLIVTYKDNEYLPKGERDSIEQMRIKAKTSKYWENKYRVYGLGLVGKIEGLVFPDWEKCYQIPFGSYVYGLDFGFSNDPTALVKITKADKLYGEELIYDKSMSNKALSDRLFDLGVFQNDIIVADSADPKSISELNGYGWNVIPSKKGSDSVNYGIQKINQYGIEILATSSNWIKEANNYKYVSKGSEVINKPLDKWNHCWDAARYACEMIGDNLIHDITGHSAIDDITQ